MVYPTYEREFALNRSRVWTCALLVILTAALEAAWRKQATRRPDRVDTVPSESKPYVEQIAGTRVSFEMVPIPGGTFVMGSSAHEPGRGEDEGPEHQVTIRPFWMGKFEVTWDEFDGFAFAQSIEKPSSRVEAVQPADTADAMTRPTPPYGDEAFGFGKGRQPVISITHHAAMEYARWLSSKTGKIYRLPTEAEWEYAARAGSATAYTFGDNPVRLGDYGWYLENSNGRPHPAGLKKPNAWGLHDVHGNVAEWCLDHYDKAAYGERRSPLGIIAPALLPSDRRYPHAVRGGSWDDKAIRLRSAARRASTEDWSRRDPQSPKSIWWHTDATFVGFRLVRPVEEQVNLKGLRSKITPESKDE